MTPLSFYAYVAVLTSILDLRSGKSKSSLVSPPRPYRRRRVPEMVVHSPDAFEAKKAAAAAAAAGRGREGAATGVPPSVLAAGTRPAAAASVTPAAKLICSVRKRKPSSMTSLLGMVISRQPTLVRMFTAA